MLLLQVGKLRQEACVSCSPAQLRLGGDPQALLCLAAPSPAATQQLFFIV